MTATCVSFSESSEYLVGYGLTGELGRFVGPQGLTRGVRVVLRTPRGVEIGEILRFSSARLGNLMGDEPAGEILRPATPEDETRCENNSRRALALLDDVPEALDCEILLDGMHAIVHLVGPNAHNRAIAWAARAGLHLTVYDAGIPVESGGCGSCGSGGGCGSGGCQTGCGGETSEVRDYFASLRTQMEQTRRVPLL